MTKSVQTKENQFVCVPPKSAKFIDGFNIYDKLYLDCGNAKHNYPKKTSEVIYYDQSTTPIDFRNRIAYTFDEKSEDIKYLDHHFWLTSIQNYNQNNAVEKVKVEDCETNHSDKVEKFTIYAPNKFFNQYKFNQFAVDKENDQKKK